MYVKVKQSAKLARDSSDEYDTIYHYTGWTTRYSAQNLTIHSYSKSSSPPEHFRQAEYGARSVPGFKVPYAGQSQGVKQVSICEKIENKKPKNIFGKGMTVKSRKVLSESCSKGLGSSKVFKIIVVFHGRSDRQSAIGPIRSSMVVFYDFNI